MASTLVYWVRHGQTAENLQGIIQGQLDTHLDGVGLEQAAAVSQSLKDIKFDIAFSSDLSRAVDTATAILKHHAGLTLHKRAILRERFMGNLQGRPAFQSQKRPPVEGTLETSLALRERTLQFWDETVIPYAKKASEIHNDRPACMLVVSHGAFINSLARAVIEYREIVKPPEVGISWCPNVSVTLVEVRRDGTGTLRSFGDISHLVKPVLIVGNADDLNELNSTYAQREK